MFVIDGNKCYGMVWNESLAVHEHDMNIFMLGLLQVFLLLSLKKLKDAYQ